VNVEELLVSKDIAYIPKGGDFVIRCLNPEHPDNNPSMRIDRVTGIFNCFSCKFKGNLFAHFEERVNQLQLRRDLLKKKIRQKAAESIGLSLPRNVAPYEGDWRNIKPETYKKFEAFTTHEKPYEGRIVFPIRNISGNISAFNARHTTGGVPKYLITPPGAKMPLFPKVDPVRGSVILVEGIYDMLNMHDKGLENTICCFGTQNINEDKLAMLRIQGVDHIIIFFDGDNPGQQAAASIKTMCENLAIKTTNIYLEGKDPGELSEKQVLKLKEKLYK